MEFQLSFVLTQEEHGALYEEWLGYRGEEVENSIAYGPIIGGKEFEFDGHGFGVQRGFSDVVWSSASRLIVLPLACGI